MNKETEARIKAIEERERQREQEREFERQLQPLRSDLTKLGDSVKGLQDALGMLQESMKAPPAQPTAQPAVPPEIQKQLDDLKEELKKRDELIEHGKIRDEIIGTVTEKLDQIVARGGNIEEVKKLLETLKAFGVQIGATSEGWPVPGTVPTWAFMIRDPKFRQGLRELTTELVEDFSGAVVRGIGGIGGRGEELGITPPKGFIPPEKPKVQVKIEPTVTPKPGIPGIELKEPKSEEKLPEKPAGIPSTLFEVEVK